MSGEAIDPSKYEATLPLPWLQASEHRVKDPNRDPKKDPDSFVHKLRNYFQDWEMDGILVKELDCQDEGGVTVYNPYKKIKMRGKGKNKRAEEFYVPFDVGSITSQLPTICNTYAPLDFYDTMAPFQTHLAVKDNFCVELFALLHKKDDVEIKKKLRMSLVHLRRQNAVVCDLLLVCALSIPVTVQGKTYHPYRTLVETCIAFAHDVRKETGAGVYYQYNPCRDAEENKFKCRVLTKEATTVLSGSIARHMGFRFYPGQSRFATFASPSLTVEEKHRFLQVLKSYFDPAKVDRGETSDRPATVLKAAGKEMPVIGPHLWSIITELNAYPSLKSKVGGDEREYSNKERLQAITSYLRPTFTKWNNKGKAGKKPKQLKPTGYVHETTYASIAKAAEEYNKGAADGVQHDETRDVETFVVMQAYMYMFLLLCPGSDVSTPRVFYNRIGASSFIGAAPESDGPEFDAWLKKANTSMTAALEKLAGAVRLLQRNRASAAVRKTAALDALHVCKKVRGGKLQSFPLLMYLS